MTKRPTLLRAVAPLLCLLLAGPGSGAAASAGEASCVDATGPAHAATAPDPRSLKLDDGTILRLAGIESFALLDADGDGAERALQERLSALAAAGPVRIRPLPGAPDRYGRQAALVEAGDGTLLQEALTGAGVAIAFAAGGDVIPCFDRLLRAEDAARRARRGLWTRSELPAAEPAALSGRVDRFVIFEGTVVSVGSRRSRSYLNFGRRWSEDVTVEIAAADRDGFGGEAAIGRLEGRRVRARGFLGEHGGPVMAIRSPMQLEILDRPPDPARSKP